MYSLQQQQQQKTAAEQQLIGEMNAHQTEVENCPYCAMSQSSNSIVVVNKTHTYRRHHFQVQFIYLL